jgi:4'-phosphopantetheinyl transferase EntD
MEAVSEPTRFEPLVAWLGRVLPAACAVAGGPIGALSGMIYPEEEACLVHSVAKRRAEYRAGRLYARQALMQLGVGSCQILSYKERDPIWPPGIIGSISHSDRAAIALVTASDSLGGLGVDIETDSALAADLRPAICREEELRVVPGLLEQQIDVAKLCFVAKEAFYKAVFPRYRQFLDFQDAYTSFTPGSNTFTVTLLPDRLAGQDREWSVSGHFSRACGHLACVIAIPRKAFQGFPAERLGSRALSDRTESFDRIK